MLIDEYLRPFEFTPVRKPAKPNEYEIPDLLKLIRNGPSEIDLRKDQPIKMISLKIEKGVGVHHNRGRVVQNTNGV
jgi:hypothetical protein